MILYVPTGPTFQVWLDSCTITSITLMYQVSRRQPTAWNHFWQSISTPTASEQPRLTAACGSPQPHRRGADPLREQLLRDAGNRPQPFLETQCVRELRQPATNQRPEERLRRHHVVRLEIRSWKVSRV